MIGGYVYRGNAIAALQGKYVFGDFLAGKIFTLDFDGTTASNFQDITAQLFPTRQGGFNLRNPSSLGEDASGELYITRYQCRERLQNCSVTEPPRRFSVFVSKRRRWSYGG